MVAPVATPTLSDLVNLLRTIKAGPAASSSASSINPNAVTGGYAPDSAGGIAAVENVPQQQLQMEQQALAAGQGKTFNDLPFDVKQLIKSADDIKQQTGPVHRGFFGSVLHDAGTVGHDVGLGRVSDILSRGMYGSAGFFKGFQANADRSGDSWSGVGGDFSKGGSEALKGFEGKKKDTFEDVIQQGADIKHFKNSGLSNNAAVNAALATPGAGHANPILKYGGGFAADIALDPTSYVGTGLVGKVLSSADKLKDLDKAVELSKNAERIGVMSKDATGVSKPLTNTEFAKGVMGIDSPYKIRPGVSQIIKKGNFLTDSQRTAKIKDSEEAIKNYATQQVKTLMAQHFDDFVEKHPLSDVADTGSRAARDNAAERYANKMVGGQGVAEKSMIKELQRLQLESLSTYKSAGVSRGLGVTFAGKHVGTIPLEQLSKRIDQAKATGSFMGKHLNAFDKTLRNSAGINPEIKAIKGRFDRVDHLRAVQHFLTKAYEGTSPEDRKRAFTAWLNGHSAVKVLNSKGEDVNKFFQKSVNLIQHAAMPEVGELDSPGVLNRYLDKDSRIGSFLNKDKEIEPKWLEKHLRSTIAQSKHPETFDPAVILNKLQHAHLSAVAESSMIKEFGEAFGHHLRERDLQFGNSAPPFNPITRSLVDNHGYRQVVQPGIKFGTTTPIKHLQDLRFEPEIAKGIESVIAHLHGGVAANSEFTKFLDKVLYEWKGAVTKYNPGFHERNLYGETYNNYLAGVKNPDVYRSAIKVLRGRGKQFLIDGSTGNKADMRASNALLPNASKLAREQANGVAFVRKIKVAGGRTITQRISPDLAWHLYDKNGLKTGFLTTTDLDRSITAGRSGVGRVLHHVDLKVQHGTENVEDFARMAHFIDALKKSKYTDLEQAAEDAAQQVKKYHFDYKDFTDFEKKKLARWFPFYKWTRKNIPLMMEMTLAKPGKVIAPLKGQNALAGLLGYPHGNNTAAPGDFIAPSWLTNDLATPVGKFGGQNTTYIDPPLPWEQAFQAVQSPKQTAEQMANPIAQILAEITLKKNLTGQSTGGANQIFANQTPVTKFIENLATNKSQGKNDNATLAQFLTGLGFMENTPNRMKAQAKANQTKASSNRKKYEHQQGTVKTTNHPGLR